MWKSNAKAASERSQRENNPSSIYEWSNYIQKHTQSNYFNHFDYTIFCNVEGSTITVEFYFDDVDFNYVSPSDCVNKVWNLVTKYAQGCPYNVKLVEKHFS